MVLGLYIYDLRNSLDVYYTSIVYPFCTGIITCHVIHMAIPSSTCLFRGCVNSCGSEGWNHSPVVAQVANSRPHLNLGFRVPKPVFLLHSPVSIEI